LNNEAFTTAVCQSVPQKSSRTFDACCWTPLCFVGQKRSCRASW